MNDFYVIKYKVGDKASICVHYASNNPLKWCGSEKSMALTGGSQNLWTKFKRIKDYKTYESHLS